MSDRQERSSMRRRAETHTSGFERTSVLLPDGMAAFKLEAEGVKRIDILGYRVGKGNPYADEGSLHAERTFWTHRGIGPNEDSYVCLAKTMNTACPICEYRSELAKRGGVDPQLLKDLLPKERQLWIVRDYADDSKGFQLWDVSFHLFGKLLDKRLKDADPDEPFDQFHFHGPKGMTLKLGITEKKLPGTSYYEVTSIDFKPRAVPYTKETINELPCLDELLVITPYEKLKEIFLQTPSTVAANGGRAGSKGAAAADDDAPPPKPKPKPAPAPAAAADDDDWGEEGAAAPQAPKPKPKPAPAPVADEDEDMPTPPPKPKPKPAPAPVADADADWDDEPTPPPAPKPKPKPAPAPAAEDDEPAPPPKPKPKPKPAPAAAPAAAADENWDDWDEK